MTTPDLGVLHGRITAHLTALDNLRRDVIETLDVLAGDPVRDWTAGQIAELWETTTHLPLAHEIIATLAAVPEEWHVFERMIPESDRKQAGNELAAFGRHVSKLRGRRVPLYDRAQRGERYKQSYCMDKDLAVLVRTVIEGTPPHA